MTEPLAKGEPRKKASHVGAPAIFALEQACRNICDSFNGYGCYLVGSALDRPDWRDVDVRFIMEDAEFEKLFPDAGQCWEQDARWLLLTVSISAHLSKVTNLPVDFQIQPQTHANERHKGPRHSMGLRIASQRAAAPSPSPEPAWKTQCPARWLFDPSKGDGSAVGCCVLKEGHAGKHRTDGEFFRLVEWDTQVLAAPTSDNSQAEVGDGRKMGRNDSVGRDSNCVDGGSVETNTPVTTPAAVTSAEQFFEDKHWGDRSEDEMGTEFSEETVVEFAETYAAHVLASRRPQTVPKNKQESNWDALCRLEVGQGTYDLTVKDSVAVDDYLAENAADAAGANSAVDALTSQPSSGSESSVADVFTDLRIERALAEKYADELEQTRKQLQIEGEVTMRTQQLLQAAESSLRVERVAREQLEQELADLKGIAHGFTEMHEGKTKPIADIRAALTPPTSQEPPR